MAVRRPRYIPTPQSTF